MLIKNIRTLAGIRSEKKSSLGGNNMSVLNCIHDAWLLLEGDRIKSFGSMKDYPETIQSNVQQLIDASGKIVLPTWCDPHTHLVFAETRETEFVDKIKGLSYQEIAQNGGGILNSANKLRAMSEEELFIQASERVRKMIRTGTGAIEIKSGYGLTVKDEMKMLRVIQKLKKKFAIPIKSTFLGAHAFPTEYKLDRDGYINLIINEMLPEIASEKLADYCDVFCDKGFFTESETDKILNAAARFGLKARVHANELACSGGVQAGVKNNAVSVDHLEHIGNEEMELLKNSKTIPVLLPSTAFFLGIKYPDARKMLDAGLPIALGSDYNPGTSPSSRMSFVVSLACIKMKMTPEEAINAATVNAAAALEISDEHGAIDIGMKANLMITENIPSYHFIPYSFGQDHTEMVIINGKINH